MKEILVTEDSGEKYSEDHCFFLFYVLISVCVTTQSNNWDVVFNFTWFFLSLNDDDVDDHDGDDDGDNDDDLSLWYRWPRKCVSFISSWDHCQRF